MRCITWRSPRNMLHENTRGNIFQASFTLITITLRVSRTYKYVLRINQLSHLSIRKLTIDFLGFFSLVQFPKDCFLYKIRKFVFIHPRDFPSYWTRIAFGSGPFLPRVRLRSGEIIGAWKISDFSIYGGFFGLEKFNTLLADVNRWTIFVVLRGNIEPADASWETLTRV